MSEVKRKLLADLKNIIDAELKKYNATVLDCIDADHAFGIDDENTKCLREMYKAIDEARWAIRKVALPQDTPSTEVASCPHCTQEPDRRNQEAEEGVIAAILRQIQEASK